MLGTLGALFQLLALPKGIMNTVGAYAVKDLGPDGKGKDFAYSVPIHVEGKILNLSVNGQYAETSQSPQYIDQTSWTWEAIALDLAQALETGDVSLSYYVPLPSVPATPTSPTQTGSISATLNPSVNASTPELTTSAPTSVALYSSYLVTISGSLINA